MGWAAFSRYRRLIIVVALLLAAAQLVPALGIDTGWGLIGEGEVAICARRLALVAFVLLPAAVALDGTRYYRESRPRARVWWYLGGLVGAILGSVGVAMGVLQVAIRAANLGEGQASSGAYLLALLVGLVLGVWVGAMMGWIGHLFGRLTLSLGL